MKTIQGKQRMNKQEEFIKKIDDDFFKRYFELLDQEKRQDGTYDSKYLHELFDKYNMQGVYRIHEYKGRKFAHILVDDNQNVLIYMLNDDNTICNYKVTKRI